MKLRYTTYSVYKDSGMNWLGRIPEHWSANRLKYYVKSPEIKLQEKPIGAIYLGLENIESWSGRLLLDEPIEDVESSVIIFKSGNILFGKLRPYLAKVALPDFDGVCTTEILTLSPRENLEAKFLFYVMLSEGFIKIVDSMTYGTKMPRANREQIGGMIIPIPPIPEQCAIADYLDSETARIDALITRYQRLIELLDEKRASLISQAVTKGLDPLVEMKDSGVEWLGEIPLNWEVGLLKRYFQVELGKMLDSSKQTENGILKPYLRAANIHWGKFLLDDVNEMFFTDDQLSRLMLRNGDLLVTEGGVTVGRSAIWRDEMDECYYQNSINRVRPKTQVSTEFLFYWIYFLKENGYIDLVAEKSTFGHLTKEKLEKIPIVIPPEHEMKRIVEGLDTYRESSEKVKTKIQRVINGLKEYRSALISAAVTGKIDVRN